ncbi:MAG TPA: polysaccharide biosynthesis/export family protein [Pyrinomonadaceae bacterium]|jgi:polysaccharide export outer membrane protein|nr:polysaccharide biosynthesis/export family protein [Pyrinomonadaceae bacterium]
MKLKVLFLFALALCLSQISFAQGTTADVSRGYLLGPGDVIEGKVLGEKDFDFVGTVDEDGKIQVPYSEGIMVQCRTEKEVRDAVVKVYSKYLRSPQVSVRIMERKSRPPATLFGEVKVPQRYELTRKATLKDLLAYSGGITEKASGMIQITHTQPVLCSDESNEDFKTMSDNGNNLPSRLYSYGSLKDSNPVIFPGDIIDVMKAPPIYVVGEVMKSGELVMPEGGLPLMQAIAMASGTTREAKIKDIKVYRRKQGLTKPEVITVNYEAVKKGTQKDLMLEPFDIVEVGKSKKSVFDIMLDIATGSVRNVANTAVRF